MTDHLDHVGIFTSSETADALIEVTRAVSSETAQALLGLDRAYEDDAK
jgi:hypothetical protein